MKVIFLLNFLFFLASLSLFSLEQLNNIRHTLSLANLLCKTTDLEAVQVQPLFKASEHNPKILCSTLPELNYELWREYGPYNKKK